MEKNISHIITIVLRNIFLMILYIHVNYKYIHIWMVGFHTILLVCAYYEYYIIVLAGLLYLYSTVCLSPVPYCYPYCCCLPTPMTIACGGSDLPACVPPARFSFHLVIGGKVMYFECLL